MRNQKASSLALLLSLIVPGLGQIYNSETSKGLVIASVCLGTGAGFFWLSGLSRVTMLLTLIIVWSSTMLDAYKTAQVFGQPQEWYFRRSYVVALLLLVGPLALPLLWRSPYFSRAARWGWTSLVTTVALLLFTTPYLLSWLIQHIPALQAALQQSGIQP